MECRLCPRQCGIDRSVKRGFCGESDTPRVARAALHLWEEPCISGIHADGEDPSAPGTRGSGTVFFSGCVMRCVYCQNHRISAEGVGEEITVTALADTFLRLQESGAYNINLVNPTHFAPQIIEALDKANLSIPVVWNSGGYERVETLKLAEGYVDIYLPDIKYRSEENALRLSAAPNYFETAMDAVAEMLRQTGEPVFSEGMLMRGTMVRHLVLPYLYKDSIAVINAVKERFGNRVLFSLMSQYTPFHKAKQIPRLNRRITTFEYEKALQAVLDAGLEGYIQARSSATEAYTPEF